MSNLHRTLSDDQIHVAKGFSTGVAGSDLWKNENSTQEFIAKVAFPPALDFKDGNAAPPISPTTGDIYVLVDLGNGAVDSGWSTGPGAGYNDWVRWSGFFWVPITPQEGAICYNKQDDDYYKFDGSDWVSLGGSLTLKTVNNESLLGAGNVDVRGDFRTTSALSNKNFIQNKPIFFPAIDFIDGNATPPVSLVNDVYVLVDMGNGVINAGWDGAVYNDWVVRGTGQWFSTSPTNGVTCYDKTSKIDKRYNGTTWVPADTGGGKLAIYNSSGVPTFYSTLTAAFAAATSGDTIQILTSYTETLTTALTIPLGVNLNLNGNTLTIDQNNANVTIQTHVTNGYIGQIINGKIYRSNGSGAIFYVNNSASDVQIDFTGLVTEYNGGSHFSSVRSDSQIKFRGLKCIGTTNSPLVSGACGIENFTCYVTSGICFQGIGNISKGVAYATSGICYNQCASVFDSFGSTVSGNVYANGCVATRCYGDSISGSVYYVSTSIHSTGLSSSGYGLVSGVSENSKLTSTSNNATTGSRTVYCILRSDSAFVANMGNYGVVKFCEIICNWNSASARGIVMSDFNDVSHNDIKMANASSYAIGGASYATSSYGGLNTARGCAAVYDTLHTSLTINTTDSKGNLLTI